MWDLLRKSTSSSDTEAEVKDEDTRKVRCVMNPKLKTQQEQPEETDPVLLLVPEKYLHTTMREYTPMEMKCTCMATPFVDTVVDGIMLNDIEYG